LMRGLETIDGGDNTFSQCNVYPIEDKLILLNPKGKGKIHRCFFLISSRRKELRWAQFGSINDTH
jgi:hypothetical protein